MKRYAQIAFTILLALALFACSPVTPATSDAVPTSAERFHPLTARTGIEDVDNVVKAVASGNVEALRSLIQFTNAKCTQRDGLGGPPKCREGEAEGTPVEVLPFLGPEGYFFRKSEIKDWHGVDASGLYAIYEVSPNAYSDENYPAGEYAIIFLGTENGPATSLQISNGRVVRIDNIFENSPESLRAWLQRDASKVILAPVNP